MNQNDSKDKKREILSAKISCESAEGWRDFCAQHGIYVTAYMEVNGRSLREETNPLAGAVRRRMIEDARAVDKERRSRRK